MGRNRLRIRIRIRPAAVLARILGRGGRTPPFEAAERNNMGNATTCPTPKAGIQGFDAYRVAVEFYRLLRQSTRGRRGHAIDRSYRAAESVILNIAEAYPMLGADRARRFRIPDPATGHRPPDPIATEDRSPSPPPPRSPPPPPPRAWPPDARERYPCSPGRRRCVGEAPRRSHAGHRETWPPS